MRTLSLSQESESIALSDSLSPKAPCVGGRAGSAVEQRDEYFEPLGGLGLVYRIQQGTRSKKTCINVSNVQASNVRRQEQLWMHRRYRTSLSVFNSRRRSSRVSYLSLRATTGALQDFQASTFSRDASKAKTVRSSRLIQPEPSQLTCISWRAIFPVHPCLLSLCYSTVDKLILVPLASINHTLEFRHT